MKKLGLGIFIFFTAFAMNTLVASAKDNQPSDKVLKMLAQMAYAQLPEKIQDKDSGKVVVLDKSKPETIAIPDADARRVIKVGYLSGKAQLCGEEAYQVANYQAMMKIEKEKKKWTIGQIIFINKLHLMTVMMTTGQITVKEGELTKKEREEAKKEIKEDLQKKYVKKSCPKKVVEQLKKDIEAFVDSSKKS